jgi:hypothetical protein
LRDLFGAEEGLEIVRMARASDLLDYGRIECKGCKIYRVLLDALLALQRPLAAALLRAGCADDAAQTSGRRLIIVGHGLGSSLGSLLAFELKTGTGYRQGTFGIEASFQFGSARIGNMAFADAFRNKIGGDIFRVTHGFDPYLRYPRREEGFVHIDQELFFKGQATWDPSSYTRCPRNGEDMHCSDQYRREPEHLTDHLQYLRPLVSVSMNASACKKVMIV